MKSPRPLLFAARFGLAVGASLTVAFGSLPRIAAAAPPATTPGHVDTEVRQHTVGRPSERVRVIITSTDQGSSEGEVREQGGSVIGKLHLGNSVVAEVPANKVDDLATQPGVVRISYDAPVEVQSLPLDPIDAWRDQLQSVYPLAVDAANQWSGGRSLTGKGIGVAVLDSGVRAAHQDFLGARLDSSSRVVEVLNGISSGSFSGDDDSGHGTFVAGIIAGRGWGQRGAVPAGSYVGVAPNVNIISVKVSNSNGMAYVSDVVAAIEWVTEHRKEHNIRVLNLSLASTVAGSYLTDMFDAAVELAWFQGLVVVVAAGNGGPNAGITAPANDPFVITVGATDDMGTATTTDDAVAPFSSYGKTADGIAKPDVVAPGRNIVSTLSSPLAPLARQFPNRVLGSGNYIRLSGTSAAAPVVSGVVAQLLEARPNLTPGQVKWLLTHTALPVTGPGRGAGYPQVGAAVDFAGKPGTTDTRTPNLYLQVAYAKQMGQTWNSDSWNNLSWQDVSRDTVSWNNVSWNNVSWNNVSWNNVSWNSVSWNSVSWNSVSWNNVAFLPAI